MALVLPLWQHPISPFTVTGAHAHWVGSTDTPSHATKELKMLQRNATGKGLKPRVEHGVTCTSICLVLRGFTVENQLAELLFLHNASLLCYNKSYFSVYTCILSPDDVSAIFIPTNHDA